jgi:hypothetical protein
MPVKDEFDTEFVFNINDYLTKNYKKMSLTDRRAICSLVLTFGDIDIEGVIDEWVANRAMILAGYTTLDELTEEYDDE